jgi:hypothetical protein
MNVNLRRWLPFFVVLTPIVILLIWYVYRTWTNTIFLADFLFVPLVGDFLNGNWSPIFLFSRFGEHLLVGTGILDLFAAKYFAWDNRIFPLMFIPAYALTAAIIYSECLKIFDKLRSIILGIIFLPLCFLCFSLVAQTWVGMSTQFEWGLTIGFLIAWFLQRDFDTSSDSPQPRWPLIAILILVPINFLVFTGSYFPGVVFGLGVMYLSRALLTGKWRAPRIFLVAVEVVICALLYCYYVFILQADKNGAAMRGIFHYFADPVGTIMFYVYGIGGSVMDQHTFESVEPSIYLIIGSILGIISLVALWLFIKTEMYRKTYLPIYCMSYTLGIITAVRVGRGLFGDPIWILNDWYSFHLSFFVIGVVWILLYVLVDAYTQTQRGAIDEV